MKFAPNGIRLSERRPFHHLQGFKDGLFEPQDEASQIAAELVGAAPGDRVLDFCAGGGGKALALAAVMENRAKSFCTMLMRSVWRGPKGVWNVRA